MVLDYAAVGGVSESAGHAVSQLIELLFLKDVGEDRVVGKRVLVGEKGGGSTNETFVLE